MIIRVTKTDEIDKIIEENDLDDMGYMAKGTKCRIRISNEDTNTKKEALKNLIKLAEKKYNDWEGRAAHNNSYAQAKMTADYDWQSW